MMRKIKDRILKGVVLVSPAFIILLLAIVSIINWKLTVVATVFLVLILVVICYVAEYKEKRRSKCRTL